MLLLNPYGTKRLRVSARPRHVTRTRRGRTRCGDRSRSEAKRHLRHSPLSAYIRMLFPNSAECLRADEMRVSKPAFTHPKPTSEIPNALPIPKRRRHHRHLFSQIDSSPHPLRKPSASPQSRTLLDRQLGKPPMLHMPMPNHFNPRPAQMFAAPIDTTVSNPRHRARPVIVALQTCVALEDCSVGTYQELEGPAMYPRSLASVAGA